MGPKIPHFLGDARFSWDDVFRIGIPCGISAQRLQRLTLTIRGRNFVRDFRLGFFCPDQRPASAGSLPFLSWVKI
jgi:hypothetical protein